MDAFQGREKEIVIFSCVRSNTREDSVKASLGFLTDERRMNVAITRAKEYLFVVGNSHTLSRHGLWANFIKHCQSLNGGFI